TCDLTLNLMEKMSQGELDLVLIKREPIGANVGQPVLREHLVWVGAGDDVLPSDAAVPLVVAPAPCVLLNRAIAEFDLVCRTWRVAYTSPSLAGQHAALRAGLGVTVLPSEMAPDDLMIFGAEHGFPPLADAEIALVRASKSLPVPADRLANF